MKPLGERLRDLRKQRNMNQRELARKAGLLPMHVKYIESGERYPSPQELREMLGALGMPVTDLFLMSCISGSLPRWALVRVADRLKEMETEMVDQFHRLPVPPEKEGDGPQERVDHMIGLLEDAELRATRLTRVSRLVEMVWKSGWPSRFVSENYWRGGWRGKLADFLNRLGNAMAAFSHEHEMVNRLNDLEAEAESLRNDLHESTSISVQLGMRLEEEKAKAERLQGSLSDRGTI